MATWRSTRRLLLLVFLSSLFLVPAVQAQNLGRLAGTAFDSSGGVLPGATVTATNTGTNQAQTAVTSSAGAFLFPQLPPGTYKVTIELGGFKTATFTNVVINVGQEYSITAKLEVGGLNEVVEVTAGTPLIQTTTPEVSKTVQQPQILGLPLAGRDMTQLIRLQAGVPGLLSAARMNTGVNGGRPSWTQVTQDGINIQDNFIRTNSVDFLPNRPTSDNVSEFTITSSVQGAEAAGGASAVRMITPSGTNTFRGSVFESNRDSKLSANSFFNNASNTPKPPLRRNQPGGRLGGPILKNKMFFFGYYEGFRQTSGGAQNNVIPAHDDWYQGVFRYVAPGESQVRTVNILQLTGQSVDAAYNAAVLSKLPRPSSVNNFDKGDSRADRVLNLAANRYNQTDLQNRDYFGGRVDFELTQNHHFEAIGSYFKETDDRPDLDFISPDRPMVYTSSPVKRFVGAWRWLITSSLQNELRAGGNLAPVRFESNYKYGTNRWAGQTGTIAPNVLNLVDPEVNFMPQGRNTNTYTFTDNMNWLKGNHAIQSGFTWNKIHVNPYNYEGTIPTVNMGFSAAAPSRVQLSSSMFPGGISAADLSTANTTLALLTGTISNIAQTFQVKDKNSGYVSGYYNNRNYTLNNFAAYSQDSWRIKPSFTLKYGLKWEYYTPIREDANLGFVPVLNGRNYRDVLMDPNGSVSFVNGGMYNADKNNFGPNIGFAWDVFKDGRTSVRGGYSLTFVNEETVTVGTNTLGANAGLSTAASVTGLYTRVSTGIPTIPTPVFKTTRTYADQLAVSPTSTVGAIDPNIRQPRVHQVSIGVGREVFWNMGIEARYVGTFGRDIWKGIDLNQISVPQAFLDDFLRARQNGYLASAAGRGFNPAYDSTIPGSQPLTVIPQFGNLTNSSVRTYIQQNEVAGLADWYVTTARLASARQMFYKNPGIYDARAVINDGWQNYHALQLEANRRFRNGFMFSGSYTLAKTTANSGGANAQSRFEPYLDNARPQLDAGRSTWNVTHNIKANVIWELPFGEGKKVLNRGGWVNAIVGNWQTSWIINLQSGAPLTVHSSRLTFNRRSITTNTAVTTLSQADLNKLFKVTKLPDGRIFWLDPKLVDPATGRAVGADNSGNTAGFTGQVFFNPTAGQVGTLPILAFDGPWAYQVDLALSKRFRFGNRYGIEFRGEFFNLFNNVTFYAGDFNINSTTFGRLTSVSVPARVIQLGARFDF